MNEQLLVLHLEDLRGVPVAVAVLRLDALADGPARVTTVSKATAGAGAGLVATRRGRRPGGGHGEADAGILRRATGSGDSHWWSGWW